MSRHLPPPTPERIAEDAFAPKRRAAEADALVSLRAIREDLEHGKMPIEALPDRLRTFARGIEEDLTAPTLSTPAEPGIGGAPLAR